MKYLTKFENIDINEGFKFNGDYYKKISDHTARNVLSQRIMYMKNDDIVNK